MKTTLSAQVSAVRRMGRLDVVKKLSSRHAEQDLLMLTLNEAALSLEEFERLKASRALAPLHLGGDDR